VGRYEGLQAAWQLVEDLEQVQRKRITPTDEGLFDNETAQKSYVQKFAEARYDLTGGDPNEVAQRIRRSPVKDPVLAAIDNWALVCEYDRRFVPERKEEYRRLRDRLLEVARAVDPHPELRDKVRSPRVWEDRRQLETLAERAPRTDLSPRLAALLAEVLRLAKGDPERLLRAFQNRHPDDFWLNFDLAKRLDVTRPAEALRFYQAALAVAPHNVLLYTHMGDNLADRCYWDEAVAVFRIGLAKIPEGDPLSVGLRNSLVGALAEKGDLEGALALARENARTWPNQAGNHLNLGVSLVRLGRFSEALDSFRRARQVAAETRSRFRGQAERKVREAERLVELERRLGAGKPEPTNAKESNEFGDVCFRKKRYADAVGFYRRAIEQDTKWAATFSRYRAACAAALAAAGRGEASGPLDAPRQSDLRKQALAWLRQDLEGLGRAAGNAKVRPGIAARLRLWERHPDLASLRDPAALGGLPADEQEACKRLWADVYALLSEVQAD
jgi:tetratricopeptide (TPR) repeat protein